MNALANRDVTLLMELSGPTVSSFGQLWIEAYGATTPKLNMKGVVAGARLDSLCTLSAFGIVDEQMVNSLIFAEKEDELLLEFCNARSPTFRELNDLSYVDQIRSLQLGQDKNCCFRAMTTRFDDEELPYLDALALSFGGHSY